MTDSNLSPAAIMALGMGFWGSKAFLSAVELGVFSALAEQPLDGEVLRARLGLHPRAATDFFDCLVALRVLEKHNGNKPAAAAELGIVLKTLYNKLNQWQEERAKSAG